MTDVQIPAGRPDPSRRGRPAGVVVRVSVGGVVSVPDDPDRLLSVSEVAARVGIRPASWRSLVSKGVAPPADDPGDVSVHRVRRSPRWRVGTVDAWRRSRPGRGRPVLRNPR